MAYVHRFVANQISGNEPAAIDDYLRVMELDGKSTETIAEYRRAALNGGLKALYQKEINKLLAQEKRGEPVSFMTIAIYKISLGQKDDCFKYIEKTFAGHDAQIVLLKTDMRFAKLRSDPRYADLIRRLGLPG